MNNRIDFSIGKVGGIAMLLGVCLGLVAGGRFLANQLGNEVDIPSTPVVTNVSVDVSEFFFATFTDGSSFPLLYKVKHGVTCDGRNAFGPLIWMRPRIESSGTSRSIPITCDILQILTNTNVVSIGSLSFQPKVEIPAPLPRDSQFADEFRRRLREFEPEKYKAPMTVYAVKVEFNSIYMTTSADRLTDGRYRWRLFGHEGSTAHDLIVHGGFPVDERVGFPKSLVSPLGGFFVASRRNNGSVTVPISGALDDGHPVSSFWEMLESSEVKKERNLSGGWRLKAGENRMKKMPGYLIKDLDDIFLDAKAGGLFLTRLPYTEFPEISEEENRHRLILEAKYQALHKPRQGLLPLPQFYYDSDVSAGPGETLLGDPSTVPVHRLDRKDSFVGYSERFRLIGDLNFDGTEDMILSSPIDSFGTGGGTWQVFLVSNAVYQCIGEVGGFVDYIIPEICYDRNFGKLDSKKVQIWSVWRSGGGMYSIVSNVINGNKLSRRFQLDVFSWDGRETIDGSLLRAIHRHKDGEVKWRAESSNTESGKVTWSSCKF